MTAPSESSGFRERLTPGPWMFVTLALLIPAVMLIMTPLNASLALPVALVLYAAVAASLLLLAPTVAVVEGTLVAGDARIPVSQLGDLEVLDSDGLRAALGPGLDARAHLMVRGYIHSGIRVRVVDPADPAPYWVVTTRKPRSLQAAIEGARP